MRARIDISEIEAETKIRAKYLRALENEEWGLLPGPAYVRSFLRTYAEALDLDAKLLLEEYKLRHERPSDHDLMPIGAPRRRVGRGGRGGGPLRPQREPRRIPVGARGRRDPRAARSAPCTCWARAAATTETRRRPARRRAPPRRRRCRRARRRRLRPRARPPRRRHRPPPGSCACSSSRRARARSRPAWSTPAARRAFPAPRCSRAARRGRTAPSASSCCWATATRGCASTASCATCPTSARSRSGSARGRSSASIPSTVPDCG